MSTEPFVREKVGRFFRKSDKLLGGVEIKPFDFDLICESDVLLMDNLKHSIIHAELHHPIALQKVVREHDKMNADLRDAHQMSPTLVPIDFTGDWRREQERSHKRSKAKVDEDEAYELELEFRRRTEEITGVKDNSQIVSGEEDEESLNEDSSPRSVDALSGDVTKGMSISKEAIDRMAATTPSPESLAFDIQKFGLDRVGKEINKVKGSGETEDDGLERASQSHKQDMLSVKSNHTQPPLESMSPFVGGEGKKPGGYVDQPVHTIDEIDPEAAEKYYEDYKSQGFEDGFRVGEEKAILQFRERVEVINSGIAKMAEEVTTLKKSVLQSVESHFVEIAQAISESLLGREFRINPTALAGMINKAIQDNVKDDVVKIYVNQESFDLLSKSDQSSGILKYLTVDSALGFGNFRVESQMSTLDGKLDKMVKDMLANITLDLAAQDKDKDDDLKVAS